MVIMMPLCMAEPTKLGMNIMPLEGNQTIQMSYRNCKVEATLMPSDVGS